MIKNYFKIAWRTLRKDPVPTVINVGGLAVGMACCLWLLMFVEHEWSYDRFHEGADRIVRINQERMRGDGSVSKSALVPPPLGPTLDETVPEIDTTVRIQKSTVEIQHDGTTEERDVLFVDPAFFEVFTFPLAAGAPENALAAPNQVVITESEARRLFGDANAVGQTITIKFENETREMQVSGVAEDPPATNSIPFSFVMPMENVDLGLPQGFAETLLESWQMGIMYTFARLDPGADRESLESNLERVTANHFEEPEETRLYAQPITDIHHDTEISSGLAPTSDPRYTYILGAIALFILLIAAINFVTLSLGRSAGRAREVGVRKSVGATQTQLGVQFWCEAVLVCGFALIGGLGIARVFLPIFSSLTQVPLQFALLEQPVLWMGLGALVLGVGLFAGGYPAWVLARKDAAPVLRGHESTTTRGGFSKALIVVQFALSVGLVASAFMMSHQLQYLTEKDLGYAEVPIVFLEPEMDRDDAAQRFPAFRQEAERHPAIHSVTGTSVPFGPRGMRTELETRHDDVRTGYTNYVAPNYVETMGLEIVTGRPFREDGSAQGILVNERLVAELGLKDPVGETLSLHDPNALTETLEETPILGVVKDYHVSSLDEEIPPLILAPAELLPLGFGTYAARLHPGQTEEGLAALASTWEEVLPNQPFQYTFLQDQIAGQYESERRWRALVGYAALLALLIACFGVFGLAALEVSRRTNEIGIRKVLGASATSLVALLSKDLVRLVALGALLAVPLAYVAMQRWLENFAYRVEPAWWIFAGAGLAALAVALATASYHTLRAAWMDPTNAIRQE